MQDLLELLSSEDDISFRKALEHINNIVSGEAGAWGAAEVLRNAYKSAEGNSLVRVRILKILTGIEDPSVVPFLESALEDPQFDVRRMAALSLKLLTDEDHYSKIYKSAAGREFKRNFWCEMNILDDDAMASFIAENEKILSSFSNLFKIISRGWTYPDSAKETYFTPRRRKPLEMAVDGKNLFKSFNYSLEKILHSGKNILYLLEKIYSVIRTQEGEHSEIEDILRCMRLSLASRLKELSEGIAVFIPAFHYLRIEYSMSVPRSQYMIPIELNLPTTEDFDIRKETLISGFKRFADFRGDDFIDIDSVAIQLVKLEDQIRQFIETLGQMSSNPEISIETYQLFRQAGFLAYEIGKNALFLSSYWLREE